MKNHLHHLKKHLKELAEKGFSLALHGYQYFDISLCLNFQGEPGSPFKQSQILIIGAGSSGLAETSLYQTSVASARIVSIYYECKSKEGRDRWEGNKFYIINCRDELKNIDLTQKSFPVKKNETHTNWPMAAGPLYGLWIWQKYFLKTNAGN